MKAYVLTALAGAALGFALSRIGFASWDEVHKMFTFADPRLLFTFAAGAALLVATWPLVRRVTPTRWPPREIHRGTLIGGALFGAGWAVCGACPGIVWVQLGEGRVLALCTAAGMFGGNWLYSVVHERWFRWSAQSCAED